ncbi:MAG: deoxyguanosinetriphosphate triphosphohydrolase [bacterium]
MLIRQLAEEEELKRLSPYAMPSSRSRGRDKKEEECKIRTAFQRDRDRIIHSKSFRQLKYKTQVFLIPTHEALRTRLTHTIEVAQIARTIAKALRLNEDLAEAISLGHDLGHPPFGHAGEEALDEICPGGFRHNEQSLRVVEVLEKEGEGLNLTFETKDGILKHSRGATSLFVNPEDTKPLTLEGEIVRLADSIAYVNHDIQDAISSKVIKLKDLPSSSIRVLGNKHSSRINTMVADVISSSQDKNTITMSNEILEATNTLRDYLYENVYPHPKIMHEANKAKRVLKELFGYFMKNPQQVLKKMSFLTQYTPLARIITDFIASLSDQESLLMYEDVFLPKPWIEGR